MDRGGKRGKGVEIAVTRANLLPESRMRSSQMTAVSSLSFFVLQATEKAGRSLG